MTRATEPVPDVEERLVRVLDRVALRYVGIVRRAIELAGGEPRLTVAQLRCLQHLTQERGATTTGLANQLHITVPSMTSRIDGLVERGLVERQPDPTSRRKLRLVITPAGRELLARYEAILHERITSLLHELAPDARDRLYAALLDLLPLLDPTSSPSAPVDVSEEQQGWTHAHRHAANVTALAGPTSSVAKRRRDRRP